MPGVVVEPMTLIDEIPEPKVLRVFNPVASVVEREEERVPTTFTFPVNRESPVTFKLPVRLEVPFTFRVPVKLEVPFTARAEAVMLLELKFEDERFVAENKLPPE